MKTGRAKRPFSMDYPTYDTRQGYGTAREWRAALNHTMGLDEAKRHVGDLSPWQILGVLPSATWAMVVKAYRIMIATVHPDRCAIHGLSVDEATRQTKQVIAAYTILKDRYQQP